MEILTYRGTNLDFDMFCEPISSYNEEKEGDSLIGNFLINLQILTTNIEKFLVRQKCAHEKAQKMKLEEERYQENFISYVEANYKVTLTYGKKGVRQIHHDLNKQKYNRQKIYHGDSFIMNLSEHSNGLASTITFDFSRNKKDKRYSNH